MNISDSADANNGTNGDDDTLEAEQAESAIDEDEAAPFMEPAFLSVGLIGQPKYACTLSTKRSLLTLGAALANPLYLTHS